jgi:catechol 2,3-dioxygenase-like lactoylglutathione lyase family enzyme
MTTTRTDVLGLLVAAVPVSDLARSAAWYRDLLDLDYVREFGDGERVTGCGLADWSAGYLVALRLRSTIPGEPDLRGEHPIIVQAADAAAAERIRARAEALGIPSTGGIHADGTWLEFLDPDGIALRVVHSADGPHGFLGVRAAADGGWAHYAEPLLTLP